ncbi:MAG: hypothetical protein AAGC68_06035, partial [Verrucomicrobiota bacterium]
ILDANTLQLEVNIGDVENDDSVQGTTEEQSFFFTIYDTRPMMQPDGQIGTKKNFSNVKGDEVYNTTGSGQRIATKPVGRKKGRFFFAVENDGKAVDGYGIRQKGAKKDIRLKYFRLTGGRVNVTSSIRTGAVLDTDHRPGELTQFQGEVRYRSLDERKRRNLRLTATSTEEGTSDTVRTIVKPSR